MIDFQGGRVDGFGTSMVNWVVSGEWLVVGMVCYSLYTYLPTLDGGAGLGT